MIVENCENIYHIDILSLRPNNWYLSEEKLYGVRECWKAGDQKKLPPVLVTVINNEYSLIDGHSRAYAAYENREKMIKAELLDLSEIEGSRALYEHLHFEGPKQGIKNISDLKNRIVSPEEHKRLWIDYCEKWMEENDRYTQNFSEFISVTRFLNEKFGIVPLLYGSMGLQTVTGIDFFPNDIDILVPSIYLNNDWDVFKSFIEKAGFLLFDPKEHEFIKGNFRISFAGIEELITYADVDPARSQSVEDKGAVYRQLTAQDYLKVYMKSSKDSYRKNKNNDKDLEKIYILRKLLKKEDSHAVN